MCEKCENKLKDLIIRDLVGNVYEKCGNKLKDLIIRDLMGKCM
jgi:hypothetical protein